jgi:hypothetical protein
MKAFSNVAGEKPLLLRDVAIRWGLAAGLPQLTGNPGAGR